MAILSVCLSICPSDTTRYCSKTKCDRNFGFLPYNSLESLVFCDKISCRWVNGSPWTKGRKRGTPLGRRYSTVIGSFDVKMVAYRHIHAVYHNKHWQWTFKNVNTDDFEWPWLSKIGGFSRFFGDFGLRRAFQEWIGPKWMTIDQDNLHIKLLALNVDFSNSSLDSWGSRRPSHAGVKEGYFSKKWLFIRCWLC